MAADALAAYAISLMKKIGVTNCPVGMYGGVFIHDKHVREHFTNKVKEIYPLVDVRIPDILPEQAAALYVLNRKEVK